MKFIILIFTVIIFAFHCSVAQEYDKLAPEWMINSSGDKWDIICDMTTGQDSSFFISGSYTVNSEITNKTDKLTGDENGFIIKLSDKGTQIWNVGLISTGNTYVSKISSSAEGEVYACGTFTGSLSVGTLSLQTRNAKSLFILKLDDSGEPVYLKQISGNFSHTDIAIANNNEKSVVVATFKGVITADTLEFSSGCHTDALIIETDDKGNFSKFEILNGDFDVKVKDVVISNENDIYIAGSFNGKMAVRSNTVETAGHSDAFLIKLNSKSKTIKIKTIGGIYDDYATSLLLKKNGNIIVAGSFAGEIEPEEKTKLKSNGVLDVFVVEFDKELNTIWADSFGGEANEYTSSVTQTHTGNIYVAGTYRGNIDKDKFKIKSSGFSNDIFLAKYNTQGKFVLLETVGDTNSDFGRKLISDAEGYIYLSGDFSNSLKLYDKETQDAIDKDFFIARLYDCDASPTVEIPADTSLCGKEMVLAATPGFAGYYWNEIQGKSSLTVDTSGIYIVKAIDDHGCVSKDTSIVNIHPVPVFDLGDTIYAVKGETVTLYGPEDMEEYLWSDGSKLSFLDVNTGEYKEDNIIISLNSRDENGCYYNDEKVIMALNDQISNNNQFLLEAHIGKLTTEITGIVINVFPNPAKYNLFIEIEGSSAPKILLTIETLEGKSLFQKELIIQKKHFVEKVNISNFEKGTYIIHISCDNVSFIKKIIIL